MRTGISFAVLFSLCALLLALPLSVLAAETDHGTPSKPEMPSDQLKKEHTITLAVAGAVREEAAKLRQTGQVDRQKIERFIDFFSNFTDRCHHAKEERFYFPAAQVYDGEEIDRQVAELKAEHAQFRAMLQEVKYLLGKDSPDSGMLAERLDRYSELLEIHIDKENRILFARADILLPPEEEKALMTSFHYIEEEELGEGFHEKYHSLAKDLAGH